MRQLLEWFYAVTRTYTIKGSGLVMAIMEYSMKAYQKARAKVLSTR